MFFYSIFDNLFIYSVAAGEKTGALDTILKYQADLLESRAAIRGKIKVALTYPMIMACVGVGVVTFLITAGYVYAIGTLGYFISSLMFLVAAFKCAGVTSWRTTLLLAAGFSSGYYVLFVKYCEVIFPKGILF